MGNRPLLDEGYIMGLKDTYGDLVTTRIGGDRTVLVFDHQLAKDALASPDYVNRPKVFDEFSLDERKKGGVLGANGLQWQHDRRFVLRNLRNLGMGKSFLEAAIHTEAEALVEDLRSYNGKAIKIPFSFRTVALNIIWQMVAGKRFDLRSEEVNALYEATIEMRKNLNGLGIFFILFPALKRITPDFIARTVFQTGLVTKFMDEQRKIVNKYVEEHERKLAIEDDGSEDLISEYLREMKAREGEADSLMWRGSLMNNVNDLFSAGSDTIFQMLQWTVYLMAKYPDIVKKMQDEIDEVVPRGRLVSLDDKPKLALVEAFATEALRYSSLVPLNVMRTVVRDTSLGGYCIPQGTNIQAVNIAVHFDPKLWVNPEEFNPGRFIAEDGKFHAPKEGFFAFGSGRRQCLGETLARMEYFLFTAALVQSFSVRVGGAEPLTETIEFNAGLRCPKQQPLVYEYRL